MNARKLVFEIDLNDPNEMVFCKAAMFRAFKQETYSSTTRKFAILKEKQG
jgi:hypothetical protein